MYCRFCTNVWLVCIAQARVPELLALGPPGVAEAGQVMGLALHKLVQRVAGLKRLGLAKQNVRFGVREAADLLDRVTAGADQAAVVGPTDETAGQVKSGCVWGISDVVLRCVIPSCSIHMQTCLACENACKAANAMPQAVFHPSPKWHELCMPAASTLILPTQVLSLVYVRCCYHCRFMFPARFPALVIAQY